MNPPASSPPTASPPSLPPSRTDKIIGWGLALLIAVPLMVWGQQAEDERQDPSISRSTRAACDEIVRMALDAGGLSSSELLTRAGLVAVKASGTSIGDEASAFARMLGAGDVDGAVVFLRAMREECA